MSVDNRLFLSSECLRRIPTLFMVPSPKINTNKMLYKKQIKVISQWSVLASILILRTKIALAARKIKFLTFQLANVLNAKRTINMINILINVIQKCWIVTQMVKIIMGRNPPTFLIQINVLLIDHSSMAINVSNVNYQDILILNPKPVKHVTLNLSSMLDRKHVDIRNTTPT